jgi:hypothetical protein
LTLYSRSGLWRYDFDVRDLALLDVDELPAADRAVGADRLDDVVSVVDSCSQLSRPRRLGRLAEAERIALLELADDRPFRDPFAKRHVGSP